jgi:hypothetical protein
MHCMAFTKKITNKITCETIKENLLTGQSSVFKRKRRGWLPSKLYEIEEKGKELSNVYSYGPCSHVWHNGANSCSMQYSMQWELYQILRESLCIKTAINTAITVKLLTYKVTLLNTCEKLKMSHEKQLELILGI